MATADQSNGLMDIGATHGPHGGRKNGDSTEVEAWQSRIQRSIAKSRKVRGGNFVQIATVDPEGRPRCRTVVFRGFLSAEARGEDALRMITDLRSEKVHQVASSPACEMVWWFGKTSEQYRIAGELQLVGADYPPGELQAARRQQWGNLSDKAREQFYWTCPGMEIALPVLEGSDNNGSEEIEEGGVNLSPIGGRDASGKLLPPPDTFLLMLLWPTEVKYLRLTDNFAQLDRRGEMKAELGGVEGETTAWKTMRVTP